MESEKGKQFIPAEEPPGSPESEAKRATLEVYLGDITKIEVEAIVNPSDKTSRAGGGGLHALIHNEAGSELDKECEKLVEESGRCPTGEARLTKGYDLPAKFIIHTVGPVWDRRLPKQYGENAKLLADCYRNSLELALENKIKSIAFSSISTGTYGYPKESAAKIAVRTVKDFLDKNPGAFDKIIFAVHSKDQQEIYQKLMV